MPNYDYDLFTIGAGSGGVRASRISASFGAKVAVAEDRYLGGTCVNVGCVPKKLFVSASHFHEDFEDSAGFGWQVEPPTFDWATLLKNKNSEIERLNGIYERLLKNAGVTQYDGRARIVDPHTVEINGEQVTAKNILVATGGYAWTPDIPGIEHAITSDQAFYLSELPKRVLMVGAGYIAVEFAGIFNSLGVETTLIYRGEQILRGFDQDIQSHLEAEMRKKGVTILLQNNVASIAKVGEELHATLTDGSTQIYDQIMYATGRRANTKNQGLENVSVELDRSGGVVVDDYLQTTEPSIYAIGDVINRVQLTPVAIAEGMALANTLFNDKPTIPNYTNIPSAVFSQPSIGSVGLTEAQARAKYENVDIYRSKFRALKHTLSGRDEQTMMKLIVDAESDRVLGVHMVGAEAGEIIQGFAVALKAGATKAIFDSTIGIHPTSAEEFVTMREKVTENH